MSELDLRGVFFNGTPGNGAPPLTPKMIEDAMRHMFEQGRKAATWTEPELPLCQTLDELWRRP